MPRPTPQQQARDRANIIKWLIFGQAGAMLTSDPRDDRIAAELMMSAMTRWDELWAPIIYGNSLGDGLIRGEDLTGPGTEFGSISSREAQELIKVIADLRADLRKLREGSSPVV